VSAANDVVGSVAVVGDAQDLTSVRFNLGSETGAELFPG
jgi:hypothetical protein